MNIDICELYHKFALLRIMIVKKGWGICTPWRNYFIGFRNARIEILNKQPDRKTKNAGMMAR
tara:strand:- start:183 stop:368 length:186 start_codon:yes stop_codon:yes gene_type:complete